jgi:hypothetical protein
MQTDHRRILAVCNESFQQFNRNKRRSIMLKQQLIARTLSTAALITGALSGSATLADDRDRNPLHPSYFTANAEKTSWISTETTRGAAYRDTHNPLHPGYGVRAATRDIDDREAAVGYVDAHNPLHPAYRF